jgi:chorismate-pyruvate lyase
MRNIYFDRGSVAPIADHALEDVRLASAILLAAASAAEAELAAHAWSPGVLAAARPLGKIIKACNELEAALAVPAHMPSPATLATIAAVEAVRSSIPSTATRATIATVEAATRAVSRSFKG